MDFMYNDILDNYTNHQKVCGFDLQFINKPTSKIGVFIKVFAGSFQERYYNDNNEVVELPNGIAHVIEHMKLAQDELFLNNTAQDDYYLNGAVSIGSTFFCLKAQENQFYDNLMAPFFKASLNLNLDSNILEEQIKVIKSEATQISESLDTKESELINDVISKCSGKNISNNLIGTNESLESITLADIKRYYEVNYVKSNMQIWVVGDFSKQHKIDLFVNKFKEVITSQQRNLTTNELFVNDEPIFPIYRSYEIKFPKFEVHQIGTSGNVHNLFIGQNSGLTHFDTKDNLKTFNWVKKVNIWNIALQMFASQISDPNSKLRHYLSNKSSLDFDNISFSPKANLFGFTLYYVIETTNKMMYFEKSELLKILYDGINLVELYFDFETFEEFYQLSEYNKHRSFDVSFEEVFEKLIYEQKYAYAPNIYLNNTNILLRFTKAEIIKYIQDFTKSDNILNVYYIKDDNYGN